MQSRDKTGRHVVKSTLLYSLAFVLPPLIVGIVVAFSAVSEFMTVKDPESWSQGFPEPPAYDLTKPTAAVLVSNQGTESTDLLAPYEILAASGALNVFTVAPQRELSPVWHGVDVLPHFSFDDLEEKLGGSPDLILIPNIADSGNSTIIDWVRRNAAAPTWVVSVCEGARVLAAAGLLHNRKASSHFFALGQLERDFPTTQWTRGVRYVEDGRFITSAGVTASIDATLHALGRVAGLQVAQRTAQELNYRMELHPREVDVFDFRAADFISLFMTAGYLWNKNNSGVLIFDGIGEVDLGSVLDMYPRVLDGTVVSIAPVRSLVRSRHGLDLMPWWSFEDSPNLDALFVTGEIFASDSADAIRPWIASEGIELKRPHVPDRENIATRQPPFVYDLVVQDIASGRSQAVARAVAKTVEYPVRHIELSGSRWPLQVILMPLAIGLASVGLVRWFENRTRE